MARKEAYNYQSPVWNTWSKDPTKAVIIRAIGSCQARLGYDRLSGLKMAEALAQKSVCFLHSCLLEVEEVHN